MGRKVETSRLEVVEICAGAGGQSLGLEQAGFAHRCSVEIDETACATLRTNRPHWHVEQTDVRAFEGTPHRGIDLLAGGVPCPPFSIAGKQLGGEDERDLFPTALRLVKEMAPRAVLIENVRGLASSRFAAYRQSILDELARLGYETKWRVLNASDFGVAQLRPRFLLVALKAADMKYFRWPTPSAQRATVADAIGDLVGTNGWIGTDEWARRAQTIAPTIVGGSKKHGGADLGPTRARAEWAKLGVNGISLVADAPSASHPVDEAFRLTVRMVARIQGFPDDWTFVGRKTAAYRQVGNAFPPPVAAAVGTAIREALAHSLGQSADDEAHAARGDGLLALPQRTIRSDPITPSRQRAFR